MSWQIDPAHTLVEFSAKHMMIATVRGRFKTFDGTLNLNDDNLAQSSVEWTVDVASIDTHNEQRDAHLRSADFFDAENHPTMTFRSTRIQALGGNRYNVTGDLTIRGTTREETFEVSDEGQAKDPWGNQKRAFSVSGSINRKDYGLNWNVALEAGGFMVGEQIKIALEVEAVQQAAVAAAATA
jgi:polyisoprenoid-binding protein YceI